MVEELEKLRLENKKLRRGLEILTEVTRNMVSTLELDELLDTLLKRLVEVTNADGGVIAILENGDLVIKTSAGVFKKEEYVGLKLPPEESFSWRVINEGHVIYQEITEPEAKLLDKARGLGIKASLGVPLKRFNKTIGSINIHWLEPYHVSEEEIHLLEITGERCAMAIMNAMLFKQVKLQAELIDLSPDAVLVRNLNDVITFWNKSAEKIYGWTREEALGKRVTELIYTPEQTGAYFKAKEITLKEGTWIGEIKQKTKDGKIITVLARFKLLYDNYGKPAQIIVVNTDITDKKKLEMLLSRAQRLEAIGRLASGVAHDLNNILSPIIMATYSLKRRLKDENDLKYVEMIESSAQRGANVVKQILSFAKGISGEKGFVQIKHLLREIETILIETFPKNIKIEIDIPRDLNPVMADPNQLMQVFMNLCVNAKDAMPDGGTLKIKAQNITLEKHYATQLPDIKPGPYILITVEDTGVGIPPEIIDKIFDPFFTTKESEKGSGLGLSIVSNIIKEHNGFINVYSEVGKGTKFNIYLPAIAEESKLEKEKTIEKIPLGNGETILVAEDEVPIQEMMKTILEENNYKVITANNGAEGLLKYAQKKDEIKLLIIDLGMPIMDGAEMIKTIRKIDPSAKIIATSGLASPTALLEDALQNISSFIQKPFDALTLLEEVTKILKS
mgnify:CR=1 FL=1